MIAVTYCPSGQYLVNPTDKHCSPCAAGSYSNYGDNICTPCSIGFYSNTGASSCLWCGAQVNTTLRSTDPRYHWTGGPTQQQCHCLAGYTHASNCAVKGCDEVFQVSGLSLGSILLNSDVQLRAYSLSLGNLSSLPAALLSQSQQDQLNSAYHYLNNLLAINVDINGDGNITRSEMESALSFRSMTVFSSEIYPLWCQSAVSGSSCSKSVVQVSDIYKDAISNFQNSSKHNFDGSGAPLIQDLFTTYPQTSWSLETCKSFDQSQSVSFAPLVTSWKYSSASEVQSLCAYDTSTGNLTVSFFKGDNRGPIPENFSDFSKLSVTNSYKRVYCVVITYGDNEYIECSVGLAYVS